MSGRDIVMPFIFDRLPVRGALVQLDGAWQRMQQDHDYAEPVTEVLGHAAAATVLIAQSLKFDGSITFQVSGESPLRMIVMQCTDDLDLRGMASAADARDGMSFGELVAGARCAVTVDGGGDRPYQGIVEMHPESLAASLENYFARSVQVPSHIRLVANAEFCGGLLLQQMPAFSQTAEDDWRRLGLLAATLGVGDFAGGASHDLLRRLFNEDDLRVFAARPTRFRCRCSRERAAEVLRLLGEAETRQACEEQGAVDVTCEYCGRLRRFDAVDITRVFSGPSVSGPTSVH